MHIVFSTSNFSRCHLHSYVMRLLFYNFFAVFYLNSIYIHDTEVIQFFKDWV